ncbi:MAG: RagB/SusD family nutrient uptake outer membrane protein [Tannerella sp.]|nr:RagB/SusD family nutrient uptake outer membrane protein [Tannerella sp.]
MKHLKYISAILILAVSVMFTGCKDDYLDTLPTSDISDVTAYSSLENLQLILNGVYRKMVSQDGSSQGLGGEPGYIVSRETLGDDLTWQTNTWHKTTHQWSAHRSATNSVTQFPWRYYYRWIMHANLVLENIDQYETVNPALHHGLKGEALAIRAYAHFLLVQMYGARYQAGAANDQLGVPIKLTSSLDPLPRDPVAKVYEQINKDLDEAIPLLDGHKPADAQTHITQVAAYGLKARVALTQQDYPAAAAAAHSALDAAKKQDYKLMEGNELYNGFAKITENTKEAVWAARTKSDHTVYFYHFMAYMSWNDNTTAIRQGVKAISLDTYEKMSPTDLRRKWWDPEGTRDDLVGSSFSSYVPYPGQVRKFRAVSQSDHVSDYAYMRIAEFYLVEAEALARQGKDAEAQAVLTEFAITRDPEYAPSNTGDALIEEIMTHRRIELWGEGFRWFDLKRLNLPLDRKGSNFDVSFCAVMQVDAGDLRWQWAIPQEERDSNPHMVPND